MTNNNNKEKSSSKFWKKLGLGKSKRSMSSLRSEPALGTKENDTSSAKRKSMIKRQSTEHHVPLPKVDLNQQFIKHVDDKVSVENKIKDPLDISTPTVTKEKKQDNNKEDLDEKKPPVPQPNVNNHREPVPVASADDDKQIIKLLKEQLEHEKATVHALQSQKQAITKDLDYLHLTVEALENEKTDLIQQLEDEKVKNLQQTEDLNLMLEKMKSTADNARDKSFAMDHVKTELEMIQTQAKQEKERLKAEIDSQNEMITSLKIKLNQSHEYSESLQNTMDQLIKIHAAEISRLATEKSTFHTPNGSPRIESSLLQQQQQVVEEEEDNDNEKPIALLQDKQDKVNHIDDLDDQLMKLTKEKERLQSFYSKIPLSGGGHQSRRRKEELESMLDQVDSKLSKVKQKIKRT